MLFLHYDPVETKSKVGHSVYFLLSHDSKLSYLYYDLFEFAYSKIPCID